MGRRWRDGQGELVVHGGGGEASVRVPLEIAASYRARTKGLLGRDSLDGAILLSPANSVHTFRMRMAIDVAYLDRRLRVIAVRTMRPGLLGMPRLRARHVVEAESGAMRGWGMREGARVEVVVARSQAHDAGAGHPRS
ncbi:uncharacterized membrane protein (UPF0127 family) [Streptomyces luteogriseus]|uniref:Uncharacterized membrane protein (UPF0127 family) n=1 Tax=Streptomyces luteogriseus TaxID=68233 RepID=A0A7W7GJC8_9ACTN|nr:DUF192 domain-containing protein [Streptomyces luteogriseus]MBB4712895.1 uncharacterized membrane protein (UPF0127 family) [Streptomyces luteogriseus]